MNLVSNTKHIIFVKDFEGKEVYSMGISKKDIAGNYINGYMPCKFRKGEHIPDKSKIVIKEAWLDFNVYEKKTYPYIFINEYELAGNNDIESNKETKTDAYEEMGKEVEIDPSELPF